MSRSPHFRPLLRPLESRDTPAFLTGAELVVGADADSPPLVRVLNAGSGTTDTQFLAFPSTFYGGVRVAVGDVTGDGYPDLVAAAGPGGGPQVEVYDGQTGALRTSFFAYAPDFRGGVYVAVGDVNGDGRAEVITGSGIGGGPEVGVFDGTTGTRLGGFFAYDASVRGGVRVAAGDVVGGSAAEIITGPGPGGGPDVRTFAFAGGTGQKLSGFYALPGSFMGGVFLATGDVTGDGKADIVVGADRGGGPQVVVSTPAGQQEASFYAYPAGFAGGVRVSALDLTGDGVAEVITGAGPGGGPQVNVFSLPGTSPVTSVYGLAPGQAVGVFVAGSPQPLHIPATPDSAIQSAYAQLDAARQAEASRVQQFRHNNPNVVFVPVGAGYPSYYGYPVGYFGYGPGFYSGSYYYYDPGFYDPGYVYADAGYYDPGYYDAGYYDPGYYDPGYYDPGYNPGYYDPGYYDPGYYDPGYFDPGYDPAGSDPGFYDTGGGGFGFDDF